MFYICREYLFCLQFNASGSFSQKCINFVEHPLKFFLFEGRIIPQLPRSPQYQLLLLYGRIELLHCFFSLITSHRNFFMHCWEYYKTFLSGFFINMWCKQHFIVFGVTKLNWFFLTISRFFYILRDSLFICFHSVNYWNTFI